MQYSVCAYYVLWPPPASVYYTAVHGALPVFGVCLRIVTSAGGGGGWVVFSLSLTRCKESTRKSHLHSTWYITEQLEGTLSSLQVLPCAPKSYDLPAFTSPVF